MKIIFYNKAGSQIVYTEDKIYFYLFSGEPVGYIDKNSIYNFEGTHLGFLIDEWIIDNHGNRVFFTKNAKDHGIIKDLGAIKDEKKPLPTKQPKKDYLVLPKLKNTWSKFRNKDFFKR